MLDHPRVGARGQNLHRPARKNCLNVETHPAGRVSDDIAAALQPSVPLIKGGGRARGAKSSLERLKAMSASPNARKA
jgi:hypothetical protein